MPYDLVGAWENVQQILSAGPWYNLVGVTPPPVVPGTRDRRTSPYAGPAPSGGPMYYPGQGYAQPGPGYGGYPMAPGPGFHPPAMPGMPMPAAPEMSLYNAALVQAAAAKQAQEGVLVRETPPSKARRLYLPMSSTGTIAAAASATITARPQSIAYRPQRIIIPATIAPNFTISDIKVGNTSQAVQSGDISAETFIPNAVDADMEFDTVQTSQDFVMQVNNVSGGASQFRATVIGRSASA